ncbi:hypothetical protein FH972_021102 [Carpinus fangiana]|uniref:K Homology domain-containing protein n=1 Tax=Carpinus fangiana TaxID=176857 RepID=A0A5N6KNR6_9ROSI|nr:hypothetical protein FH972_021102 [Carpinus fangiana]
MHKITGSARHGWERMTPNMGFGMQRQQPDLPPHLQQPGPGPGPMRHQTPSATSLSRQQASQHYSPLSLSFNVPFSSNLPGPEPADVLHSTPGAFERWTHPEGHNDEPVHNLPVHAGNVENLSALCQVVSESSEGRIMASVSSSEPKSVPGLMGPLKALVTNVCLSGDPDAVKRMRGRILNDTPILLRCSTVDIDQGLVADISPEGEPTIRQGVLEHINYTAKWTGADIFLLKPRAPSVETASFTGTLDNSLDQRFRLAVFGDMESSEHAKTRLLIMIDQILELSMHTMICGRLRRRIKEIESATGAAIYFPPPFPQLYGYTPTGATRRREDEIFITGETEQEIMRAKMRLHELARHTQAVQKEVKVSADKIDSILLERLDKIRRIIEFNGSYVLFPPLGVSHGTVRVQGTDMLHVERTSGQFYAASWWVTLSDANQRGPTPAEIQSMLADICISSGAEISFEKLTFHVCGSDDAVKAALWIISTLPFVKNAQSHLRIKIELANEHKEFVSGKKNGKINKIMSQSNVQVYFDLFNEYNFFIDVSGPSYEATKNGLELVEQEMPASIAFHVPDQYHKRIIGIGGQHIQRIMKKYSVFVKFSNAMDRGGVSKDDDDIKVDNVICRTPARNAQNLDLVKQEIMDMVEKVDAEFVSEQVVVNRLFHRELLGRMKELDEMEKKYNCKINFPSTEEASDIVTVMGPEYQVPHVVDAFLGMVPENHEIQVQTNDDLARYFTTADFQQEVVEKLWTQHEVKLLVHGLSSASAADTAAHTGTETMTLSYTRNNAGGLKDAIDFLTGQLSNHGLDVSTVRGAIPRPKSDSFEDSLPFFDSKLLHRAEPGESPTRSVFSGDNSSSSSFFGKLRKPGSIGSFSSFLDRRRQTRSPAAASGFMKHASANASKASLVSLESTGSGYRNPWNDSGVNLTEDDGNGGWPARFSGGGDHNKFALGLHPMGAASSASLGGSINALPPPGSSSGLSSLGVVPPPLSGLAPGDATPRFEPQRISHDSGRPSTRDSDKLANGSIRSGSGDSHGFSSMDTHSLGPIGPPSASSTNPPNRGPIGPPLK